MCLKDSIDEQDRISRFLNFEIFEFRNLGLVCIITAAVRHWFHRYLKMHVVGKPSEYYRGQLGQFGVSGDLATRPVVSLSGGQKSRVAFALLSMMKYDGLR